LENTFSRSLYDANTRTFVGKERHALTSCDIFKAAVAFDASAISATSAAMQRHSMQRHSMQLFCHIKRGWLVLTPTPHCIRKVHRRQAKFQVQLAGINTHTTLDTKSSSQAGQIPSAAGWY
jgi:hypothetical protein